MSPSLRLSLLLGALLGACAHPPARPPPFGPQAWVTSLDRDQPLVGRIWDAKAAAFVDAARLGAFLARADVIILGETHDNPDHHALQASLLGDLTASGRRPALAMEMLDVDQQAPVDALQAVPSLTADELGKAVAWDKSGWPEFKIYRPILVAGLGAGLKLVAANLSRPLAQEVIKRGPQALGADLRERIDREGPLPEAVQQQLREEMAASHCGMLPERLLDPMVLAQRARDAQMAERVEAAARTGGGVVLIAGDGHARRDRGVPAFLARSAAGLAVASIAFLEVGSSLRTPRDWAPEYGDPLPFDYVIFTPRAAREDPCEGLRAHMEKIHREHPKPGS